MNKKIALMVFASVCITLFLTQFNAYVAAIQRKPLAPQDLIFEEGKSANDVDTSEDSIAKVAYSAVILNQTFDDEKVGDIPKNWAITQRQYGSFTIDNQTCYSGGKSAKFVDNSTVGSPCPYRTFPAQNGTITVTFAIRLDASSGINTNLSIWVDDGNFAGSNIYFTNKSTIEYRDDEGFHILCNYTAKEWYEIKMIMNVPDNVYEIYIDEIRIIRNATFYNFNVSRKIRRIVFGEAPDFQPIGHIDSLVIRRITSIRVPEDYSRIQEAIDMASPGITILVASSDRPYYEHICIRNKHDLWLKGDKRSTTIIDGRFEGADMDVILIDEYSCNVTISGFTIRKGSRSGISIRGSNNTIFNNIIANNTIGANCIVDGGNILYRNNFICNTQQAVDKGTNKWDNGTQGNYWSDCDIRDENGDGICDRPYLIPFDNKDNHPLFLIQNVSRSPYEPSYDQKVSITATILEDVQIDKAILNFTCDSTWESINMIIRGNKFNATIRGLPYDRTVQYKIRAIAVCGVWVLSKTFSYTVTDKVPPRIESVDWTPKKPTENDAVKVSAKVSEPKNASGIDNVILNCSVDGGLWWSIPIINKTGLWEATIPKQPRRSNVTFYVKAFDKAKPPNSNKSKKCSYKVGFSSLKAPDILDFNVTGEGQTKAQNFIIKNEGDSTLNWSITIVKGPWIKNVNPMNGLTGPGGTSPVRVIIDTTNLTIGLKQGEIRATSNGGNKSIYLLTTVTKIIIDRSSVSDDHCDIGSNQTIYFHAMWAHNYSAVQNGRINVTCIDHATNVRGWAIYMTNATGWVSFTNCSLTVGKRTWMVTGANCSGITSYVQEALNPSIIGDRVNIILAIQKDRIKVGENAIITWSGKYEYDGATFKGSITLNDTQTQYTTPGKRVYTTLSISDPVHGLGAFTSNSIMCTWEEIPFWTQWAVLMVVAVVTAMGGGVLTTLAFWTMRAYKKKS